MAVTRGRIVRAPAASRVRSASTADTPRRDVGRRVVAVAADAAAAARARVAQAERDAEAIVLRARVEASAAAVEVAGEARAAEEARLAAAFLALRAREEAAAERDVDRAIGLSVVLAERLVGAALEVRPERIALMARQALHEARGARRAIIEAHPLDAAVLSTHLESLGLPRGSVDVHENPELARGALLLSTDLGPLNARLTPQLERLAAALRDALRR